MHKSRNYRGKLPVPLHSFACTCLTSSALLCSLTHCLTNHTSLPGPLTYMSPGLKTHVRSLVGLNRCILITKLRIFHPRVVKQDITHKCGPWNMLFPPTALTYPASNPFIPPVPMCCYYSSQFLSSDFVLSGDWQRLNSETQTWNKKFRPCVTRSTISRSSRTKARNKAIRLHKPRHVTEF